MKITQISQPAPPPVVSLELTAREVEIIRAIAKLDVTIPEAIYGLDTNNRRGVPAKTRNEVKQLLKDLERKLVLA